METLAMAEEMVAQRGYHQNYYLEQMVWYPIAIKYQWYEDRYRPYPHCH